MKAFVRVRTISLVAALALAAAAPGPTFAAARANFDGNWSVLIVTDSGPCNRAYRYGVAIRSGSVIYEGNAPVNVAGRVGRNGAVNVRVWAGSQSASGAGRLSRDYGSGRWRGAGSADSCAGSWTVERR
jgi:hypothetical protein